MRGTRLRGVVSFASRSSIAEVEVFGSADLFIYSFLAYLNFAADGFQRLCDGPTDRLLPVPQRSPP